MSRSVAVSFNSLLLADRSTFERIGIVFRRSTTLATWPSALGGGGFSLLSRMVARYPQYAPFPLCLASGRSAFWLRSGPGKSVIRREELPVELDPIEAILQERPGRRFGLGPKPPVPPSPQSRSKRFKSSLSSRS